jgi:uncharacterized protein
MQNVETKERLNAGIGTIRTYHGFYVNVVDPDPATINIFDIAHHLSLINRWCGASEEGISVAQHSLIVAELVDGPQELKLCGLLHDATEAYMQDIPSPIKALFPEYIKIEHNLMSVIAKKFGLKYPFPEEIKIKDLKTLQIEWKSCILQDFCDLGIGIVPMSAKSAESSFLEMYYELTNNNQK